MQQNSNNNTLQLNWKLNNNNNKMETKKGGIKKAKSRSKSKNYSLREVSLKKRLEVEHRKREPKKRGPKPRPKPQPMSKYRRKTANLRERERMGEINNAFERLREQIPAPIITQPQPVRGHKCEKMTKINILHVTINYIRALESILDTGDAGVQVYGTSVVQSPFIPLPVQPESVAPIEDKSARPLTKKSRRQKKSVTANGGGNAAVKKVLKKRTKKPSSSAGSSGSEDSGIASLNGDDEEENMEAADFICPDWTELTCTLDFPSTESASVAVKPPVAPLLTVRGNLDTLLASTGNTQTANGRAILQPILNRQPSFPDLGGCGDLFSDLNASFDSAMDDGIHFTGSEDPFELVF